MQERASTNYFFFFSSFLSSFLPSFFSTSFTFGGAAEADEAAAALDEYDAELDCGIADCDVWLAGAEDASPSPLPLV